MGHHLYFLLFDSAHFLFGYEGKCRNIHGHRWRVVVTIKKEALEQMGQLRGMIVDFSDLKRDVKEMVDFHDHSLIYEEGSLKEKTLEALKEENFHMICVPFRPTAENFSKYFFDWLVDKGYSVRTVEVYETPNNCATYGE